MKKTVAILLALLLLPCVALAEPAESEYAAFSQWPVADGSLTVSIYMPQNSAYGVPAEETWFWPWFEEVTGIDFEITQILDSAMSEQKNLIFASGDLPDVLLGFGLTANEIVQYGNEEGLLLPLNEYINDDVMPNLVTLMEYYPDIKSYITSSDGNIYTLCWVWEAAGGEEARTFIDTDKMRETGIEAVPTTLDAFTDMLYAMKEQYGEEIIPLGGGFEAYSPFYYILNAFGYVGPESSDGTAVAVRDGHAVIPATDETFYGALELMNQFYADGIIDRDFFTLDTTAVNAKCYDGLYGVYPFVPATVAPDDKEFEKHWVSVTPLTSNDQSEPEWRAANSIYTGGFALSAQTENAEAILRAFDALFAYEGHWLAWEGPVYGSETTQQYHCGGRGVVYDEEEGYTSVEFLDANGEKMEGNAYRYSVPSGVVAYAIGNYSVWFENPEETPNYFYHLVGVEPVLNVHTYETYEGERIESEVLSEDWRLSIMHYIAPYTITGYPSVVYMSSDDALRIAELEASLVPYMSNAIAQFITGDRPLNPEEFESYLQEIEGMGAAELNELYDGYYQQYLANLE